MQFLFLLSAVLVKLSIAAPIETPLPICKDPLDGTPCTVATELPVSSEQFVQDSCKACFDMSPSMAQQNKVCTDLVAGGVRNSGLALVIFGQENCPAVASDGIVTEGTEEADADGTDVYATQSGGDATYSDQAHDESDPNCDHLNEEDANLAAEDEADSNVITDDGSSTTEADGTITDPDCELNAEDEALAEDGSSTEEYGAQGDGSTATGGDGSTTVEPDCELNAEDKALAEDGSSTEEYGAQGDGSTATGGDGSTTVEPDCELNAEDAALAEDGSYVEETDGPLESGGEDAYPASPETPAPSSDGTAGTDGAAEAPSKDASGSESLEGLAPCASTINGGTLCTSSGAMKVAEKSVIIALCNACAAFKTMTDTPNKLKDCLAKVEGGDRNPAMPLNTFGRDVCPVQ